MTQDPDQTEIDALVALHGRRQFEEMLARGGELAERFPSSAVVFNLLAGASGGLNQPEKALEYFARAIALNPDNAGVHNNRGNLLHRIGRFAEAAESFGRAAEIKPDYHNAHFGLGNALKQMGRMEEAQAAYQRALGIKPDYALAHNNLGNVFKELKRLDEARSCFERAIALKPDYAEAHHNRGLVLFDLHRPREAAAAHDRALAINPAFFDAYAGKGMALLETGDKVGMIAAYETALRLKPDDDAVRTERLYQQAAIGDWENSAADRALAPELGIRGKAVNTLAMLALEDAPARHRIRAEKFASMKYKRDRAGSHARPVAPPARLRLGYFSADFHDHPVMHLLARIFELHDRDAFEVHAFDFGARGKVEMHDRLRRAFDHFHEVRELGDEDVAALARRHGIDIAIDLMGYTRNARLEIFELRPAPVQIAYMGYPGTLGTSFMDYLIADRVIIPEAARDYYTEQLIYLPETYQGNDDTRRISTRPMSRAELGLPASGFVFGCFNNAFKITPAEFDIWMRLLDRVPGSVLWLFDANRWVADNLRKEAERRGVDADRLIFAGPMPHSEHLARISHTDLFLDCFAYGAHATAGDALWAGVPVLTMAGEGFAARVGASLLQAIGLPELITGSREHYEEAAFDLAKDPAKLGAIRDRLARNRKSMPLFNSERFTRHLEDGYRLAYRRWFDGLDPATIEVKARD